MLVGLTRGPHRWLVLGWLLAIWLSLWPLPSGAASEFSYETDVTYAVSADGNTQVTESFVVRNNTPRTYLTQITLSIPTKNATAISASYHDGGTVPATSQVVNSPRGDVAASYQEITLQFPRQIVGQGRRWGFSLRYSTNELVETRGGVRQVYIPYLDPADARDKYNVRVEVPKAFGRPHFPAARASSSGESQDRQFFNFTREELAAHPLAALVFGDHSVYDVNFQYPLQNNSWLPRTFTITLPPDTNNQRSHINALRPAPKRTYLDSDGNVLADYMVPARSKLTVETDISVAVRYLEYDLGASKTKADMPADLVTRYTSPSQYWQTSGPVATAAAKLVDERAPVINNVRVLHQFVIDHLRYNKEKIKFNVRQGAEAALARPDNVVCLEYSDLLVALLRSQGIPARMLVGYAYRNDLKQSASVVDSLHAWVEAYVPGIGWITLDPTWSEDNSSLFGKTDLDHVAFAAWGVSDDAPESVMQGDNRQGYQYEQTQIKFRDQVTLQPATGAVSATRHALLPFLSLERIKVTARAQLASDNNRVEIGSETVQLGSLAPGEQVVSRRLVWGGRWNAAADLSFLTTSDNQSLVLARGRVRLDYRPMMVAVVLLLTVAGSIAWRFYRRQSLGPTSAVDH